MALLNFANLYSEVEGNLSLPEATSGDYVKLFFTKDGHIISHGVDYTPLFGAGKKGLVSGSTGSQKEFLRGNNKWLAITTADLPMVKSPEDIGEETIFNSQQVEERITQIIAANDALVYKGTIEITDTGGYITVTKEGTTNNFPQKCKVGDTYRIIKGGDYAGHKCEVGDLLSAIIEGPAEGDNNVNSSKYWTAIQTNINGQVINHVNNTAIPTYSSSTNVFNIYAPTTAGAKDQVLLSAGGSKAPVWANQSSITAGNITDSVKKSLFTNLSLSNTGTISITVGGTTKTATASGNWNINILGSAAQVGHELSVGRGLSMEGDTFNGKVNRTINLLLATTSTVGGVMIDNGDSPTISIDSTGKIYLSQQNIVNALGFMPGAASGNKSYTSIITDSATSTTANTKDTLNPFINLIQTANSAQTVAGKFRIAGIGSIVVRHSPSSNADQISISIGTATDSLVGGIKTGFTQTAKKYAVQLENQQAYVEVPWVNTTYGLATNTNDGLVPKFDAVGTGALEAGSWVLSKLQNGTYDWYALPATAFSDTWRAIKVNGTQILGTGTSTGALNLVGGGRTTVASGANGTVTISSTWRDVTIGGTSIGNDVLNFVPSGSVVLKLDTEQDGITNISYELCWYNISSEEYEFA